jgi:ankyrin repeat protein
MQGQELAVHNLSKLLELHYPSSTPGVAPRHVIEMKRVLEQSPQEAIAVCKDLAKLAISRGWMSSKRHAIVQVLYELLAHEKAEQFLASTHLVDIFIKKAEGLIAHHSLSGVVDGIKYILSFPKERSLIHAVQEGGVEEILKRIEFQENPNVQDANGRTPLMYAAKNGWKEIVQKLLDAGADRELRDRFGKRALDYAGEHAHRDIANILDPELTHKLFEAILREDVEETSKLLALGADPNQICPSFKRTSAHCFVRINSEPPFSFAFIAGSTNERLAATVLPYIRPDLINDSDKWAVYGGGDECSLLSIAVANNWPTVVKGLLERGADANVPFGSSGDTVLSAAAKKGRHEIVQALLKAGAKLDDAAKSAITQSQVFSQLQRASAFQEHAWAKRHALVELRAHLLGLE